jgi:hypothetical protein
MSRHRKGCPHPGQSRADDQHVMCDHRPCHLPERNRCDAPEYAESWQRPAAEMRTRDEDWKNRVMLGKGS